jgi:hypothetical protein
VEAAERNQVRKRAALAAAAAAQAKLYPPTAAAADAPAPEAFAAAPVMPPILDVNAAPPTGARAPGAGRVTPAQLVSALRGPAPLVGRCRFTVSNPALKPPAALKMKSHTFLSIATCPALSVLLDVRPRHLHAAAALRGSINIPLAVGSKECSPP